MKLNHPNRYLLCLAALWVLPHHRALAQSPATELRDAVRDLEQIAVLVRPGIRYLSLYATPSAERDQAAKVLNYTLNALSSSRALVNFKWIGPTLVRINVADYAPRQNEFDQWRATWEKLAELDPYWHIRTQVRVNGTIVETTVDGGWMNLDDARRLREMTLSKGAILRADYFIATALATPRYYEFTGVPPKEADFLHSLGVDFKRIDELRANVGANLIQSQVTFKPRRLMRMQGPLGGVYSTYDVDRVDAARDPIRRPIDVRDMGLVYKFDVSEWFALAPNGLWRVALFDNKGRRQGAVPDKVAKDTSDPHGDGIVVAAVSCIRCHVEDGLRPFQDDQTTLLSAVPVYSYDPAIVLRLQEFYQHPRMLQQMEYDREVYRQACAAATGGMTSQQLADALTSTFRAYAYTPVTLDQAARECDTTVEQFRSANAQTRDPILLTLLADRIVLRDQWTSSFAETITAVEARQ